MATPDGYRMRNLFLAVPILQAYVPQTGGGALYSDKQVVGMPAWLTGDQDHYDIDAKVDEADLADWQNPAKQPAMLRTMLQAMLAERLKLVVHRTSVEGPVYALVIGKNGGKNGPKFQEPNPGEPHPGGYPLPGGGMLTMERNASEITVHYFGISMGQLASLFLHVPDRPTEDRTGLTGKYDITMQHELPPAAAPAGQPAPGSMPDLAPSPFLLAEKLGLKLEPATGRVETLVIDHVEKPSGN